MPLTAVEPKRLYRQIADQIAQLIASGEFPAGARLPAERELAVSLGVSRTSVREAIISLEMSGLVEVRVGTGIFVTGPDERRVARAASTAGPVRSSCSTRARLVEGEIAALAARQGKPDDFDALRAERGAHGVAASTISRRARTPTAISTCASPRPPATARSSSSSTACGTSAPSCGAGCSSISIPHDLARADHPRSRGHRQARSPRATPTARAPRCIATSRASRANSSAASTSATQRLRRPRAARKPAPSPRHDRRRERQSR